MRRPAASTRLAGRRALGAEGRTESIQLTEVAHAAFVKFAIFLKYVSLADGGTRPHRPLARHRQSLDSIRNRIGALVALTLDAVRVLAFLVGKKGMSGQN